MFRLHDDEDCIDDDSHTEKPARAKPKNSRPDFTFVKTVQSQIAEQNAEGEGYPLIMFSFTRHRFSFFPKSTKFWSFCLLRMALHKFRLDSRMLKDEVYRYLTRIPHGKVVTYGQIADFLGNKKLARAVGNVLHNNPDPVKYPCYKVVNATGELSRHFAFGGIEGQKARLQEDGVEVIGDRVDLLKFQFRE